MPDVIDMIWQELQAELDKVRAQVVHSQVLGERSETTGGVEAVILADAPLAADGAAAGDMLFITNGRKSGEGGGAGTGVPAYYNAGTDTWKRFEDNADVVI